MRAWIALGLVVVLAVPSYADDPPAGADSDAKLEAALAAFFAQSDPGARAAAGLGLAAAYPEAARVAGALPGVRRWALDAPKDDVVTWKRASAYGAQHTICAYIPAAYDPAKAWPVLLWLHGAVSRTEDGGGFEGARAFAELADEEGFLVLAPSATQGSEWWTPSGVDLVRGALDDLAARWHVDADRVAVAGFSDGASGCFHLLAHDPERYCCFLAMMPHPGVTRLAGGPSFAANVRSRPVFAVSGGLDMLYPSVRMKPLIEELRKAGCALEWLELPEAGHQLGAVLPEHWTRLRDFWRAHPRQPLAPQVAWETGLPDREGRFGWIEILEVDPAAPSAAGAVDAILPDAAGRPRLGVRLDRAHAGPGVRLEHVEPESAAEEAGFRVGDVVVGLGEVKFTDKDAPVALMRALAVLGADEGVFHVQRGDETLEIRCRPRVAGAGNVPRPKELGYDVPSGRVEARVGEDGRIDLTTRHVARLALHLADGLVDLSKPLHVYVNGVLRFEGLAAGDTGYVLQQAVRQLPGSPVYRAKVILKP